MPRSLLRLSFWLGVICVPVSGAVHLSSILTDGVGFDIGFVLHGLSIGVAAPVIVWAVKWAEKQGYDMQSFGDQKVLNRFLWSLLPTWQRVALIVLALYVLINFVLALPGALSAPPDAFPTRLFSGHWMVFFFASAVFAHRILALPPEASLADVQGAGTAPDTQG